MASVYGRVAKISNVAGRSSYLNDEERQEEIVLHKENMQHSWQEHSSFEKVHQKTNVANNEALEVHIALPNELAQDKEKLEQVCDDLAYDIVGENNQNIISGLTGLGINILTFIGYYFVFKERKKN